MVWKLKGTVVASSEISFVPENQWVPWHKDSQPIWVLLSSYWGLSSTLSNPMKIPILLLNNVTTICLALELNCIAPTGVFFLFSNSESSELLRWDSETCAGFKSDRVQYRPSSYIYYFIFILFQPKKTKYYSEIYFHFQFLGFIKSFREKFSPNFLFCLNCEHCIDNFSTEWLCSDC